MVIKKEIRWIGSSRKDIKKFPEEVRDDAGTALMWVQCGVKHPDEKPLKGIESGVLELILNHDSDTYRVVYFVKFLKCIYVLHAFQKKSKKGIETPKKDIDLIKSRLKLAKEDYNFKQNIN